jgi:hypothetical protein
MIRVGKPLLVHRFQALFLVHSNRDRVSQLVQRGLDADVEWVDSLPFEMGSGRRRSMLIREEVCAPDLKRRYGWPLCR